MGRLRITGCLLAAAALMMLPVQGVSADIFNRVVAIVNEEVITLHELDNKVKEITGLTPEDFRTKNSGDFVETRRKILDLLIDEKITQSKIRELKIEVTQAEIDAAIERVKTANKLTHADLMDKLKEQGIGYDKYRQKIKEDFERARLINIEVKSKILVRDEDLRQYYEDHKKDYATEGQVHLAGIFLTRKEPNNVEEGRALTRKAEDILARLKNGEDFGSLAKKYSQGPGADDNGDLGFFKTSQLEANLRGILEDLSEGGIGDLIKRADGIQIIKLVERQEASVKPFEDVRDAIYSTLYGKEVDKRYTSWIQDLRKGSYTQILL